MATFESDKSANDSLEALFDERALLYDEESLPEAGKTPTTPVQGADLAAAVDGGKGDLGLNSSPARGYMCPLPWCKLVPISLRMNRRPSGSL